jgi:hypothetical protein
MTHHLNYESLNHEKVKNCGIIQYDSLCYLVFYFRPGFEHDACMSPQILWNTYKIKVMGLKKKEVFDETDAAEVRDCDGVKWSFCTLSRPDRAIKVHSQ